MAANGIFAVSNKIPTIINLLNTIFQQAWQMSAIEEYNDSDQENSFISSVYEYFVLFMVLGTSGIMIFVYPIVAYTFSSDYFSSLKYIPFLLIAAMFSSFAGFLGTNYVAAKNTIGALKTSFVGAAINVILTFIFIKGLGLTGVSYAMIIAYFITWVYRIFDTKSLVETGKLSLSLRASILLLLLNGFFVSRTNNLLSVIFAVICFLIIIILNFKNMNKLIKNIKKS